MKNLNLTIKKKWFEMIVSGEKKEEYREIKPYWEKRFSTTYEIDSHIYSWIQFDRITARNGYQANSNSVTWKHEGIRIGEPNPKWCEPEDIGKKVFILSIGELIK